MRHVGFTGTQRRLTQGQNETLHRVLVRLYLPNSILHFGDCIGADQEAALLAQSLGYRLHSHPPDNDRKRAFVKSDVTENPLPYLVRNKNIVDSSQILIACPSDKIEQLRSGTWATVRHARKLARWILFVYCDGSAVMEYQCSSHVINDLQSILAV